MKNGVFDKEVYLNRLRLNRITPELFENIKRQELTHEQDETIDRVVCRCNGYGLCMRFRLPAMNS